MAVRTEREMPEDLRRVLERLTPEEKAAGRERVLCAAIEWVYDPTCSAALAELEESVEALVGVPRDGSEP